MTTQEFKEIIAGAKEVEWFKSVEVSFSFPYINETRTFKGLTAIYAYVSQEIAEWNGYEVNSSPDLRKSLDYFTNVKNQIEGFVNRQLNEAPSTLNATWRRVVVVIEDMGNKPIPSDSPYTKFLVSVFKHQPEYLAGAYKYVVKASQYHVNDRNFMTGTLMAYEFERRDQTDLISRRDAEKKSLSQIRTKFSKYLSESENQVLDLLKNLSDKYDEYVKRIDELKTEKSQLFHSWFENTKGEEWKNWFEPATKVISELEETYKQKLKLEEPALYWSARAKRLNKHGWTAMVVVVLLVGITTWSLGKILWNTPEQIYSSWFAGDKSAAIRWSIVYITLISFVAYCIKTITKVMFSSFHLARDCEERYTLTYFYLSLLKDSNVDEKDRQLIIQSLFSRAETGLLKDDSSPTMPNESLGKFFNK
jgi:hypothetical protein